MEIAYKDEPFITKWRFGELRFGGGLVLHYNLAVNFFIAEWRFGELSGDLGNSLLVVKYKLSLQRQFFIAETKTSLVKSPL